MWAQSGAPRCTGLAPSSITASYTTSKFYNLLLLLVIYDQVINGNDKCAVTFIDFAAAFDSVSHKFLDLALQKAGAKRKTRDLFRAIYAAAEGAVRLSNKDGKISLSKYFDIARGVIQGEIISPIFLSWPSIN